MPPPVCCCCFWYKCKPSPRSLSASRFSGRCIQTVSQSHGRFGDGFCFCRSQCVAHYHDTTAREHVYSSEALVVRINLMFHVWIFQKRYVSTVRNGLQRAKRIATKCGPHVCRIYFQFLEIIFIYLHSEINSNIWVIINFNKPCIRTIKCWTQNVYNIHIFSYVVFDGMNCFYSTSLLNTPRLSNFITNALAGE